MVDQIELTLQAAAVSRIDNLEFLSDVVPKTKSYRQFKEEKAQEEVAAAAAKARPGSANGINGDIGTSQIIETFMRHEQAEANGAINGPVTNGGAPHSPMADRTVQHSHPDPIRDLDVEMSG